VKRVTQEIETMASTPSATAESDPALSDLGPLAWVLDELRKSLDGATKAMHRFVRDAALARGSNLSELDTSHLRVARQQLHQAVGALEMVGLPAPARLLHGMESVVQRFVQRPELCSDDAAVHMERASFAVTEYLEGLLKGKSASSVALFPQYRAVMELAGAERIHPADLWPLEWRWQPVALPPDLAALPYAPGVRVRLDRAVLKIVKTSNAPAATRLAQICAGLSVAQSTLEARSFWAIAAGYFEAMGLSLVPADIYTKRTASRILQQYATLAKGVSGPSERLAQDLVFFCAQAQAAPGQAAPALAGVRLAYGLENSPAVNYTTEQFGRFDPAQLVLARKRIAAAAETWSALAGGDTQRLKHTGDQFAAVAESMVKLHPQSSALANALTRVVEATVRSGAAPVPSMAMEVATSVLYLEAAYQDLDPTEDHMAERSARLAGRLQRVQGGTEPEPLEGWMEELYRRVSDRQTMGSVVDELRASLSEVETSLDKFFRDPGDKSPLREVPNRLSQMRGVFSVLGLDQPALASLRMRSSVEHFLVDEVHAASARSGIFEKIGNSLGALGLLIDMLSYQRAMAKKLFVYDEEAGEFKSLMGRQRTPLPPVVEGQSSAESQTGAWALAAVAPSAVPEQARVLVAVNDAEDEAELKDVFLEEAREVVRTGLAAARALAMEPSNLADQTTLRRAFHTLKGSARMVGLTEFGEAAWACEQMFNAWLAEQKPASDDLISFSSSAMSALGRWIEAIAGDGAGLWSAADFRHSADAMRLHGEHVPLQVPGAEVDVPSAFAVYHDSMAPQPLPAQEPSAAEHPAPDPEFVDIPLTDAVVAPPPLPLPDFSATQLVDGALPVTPQLLVEPESDSVLPDFESTQAVDLKTAQALQPAATAKLHEAEVADLGDLSDLDFGGLLEPLPETSSEPSSAPAPESEPVVLETADNALTSGAEEQVKVIGDLRLGIPLYNVFLNEADEWSRRLQSELSEWAMESHRPIADSTVALAHSLGGIAATVGFVALAEVARTLEHALEHVKLHAQGTVLHAQVYNDAAEEIRRLLHQFAAGFLKPSDAALLQALKDIVATEFAAPVLEAAKAELPVASVEVLGQADADSGGVVATLAHTLAEVLPAGAPLSALAEDTIEAQDHLDADLFPIFQEEAMELMPALGTALRQWVARPENLGARAEALRVLHTLKGSARLAGALRLGEMVHRMESGVEALGMEDLLTAQLEPLLAQLDGLQANLDALDLAPRQDISQPLPDVDASAETLPLADAVAAPAPNTPPPRVEQVMRQAPRSTAGQLVRVRTQLLDRLVNQAGEVMISRSRLDERVTQMRSGLGELTSNLDRLRQQLRDVEVQAESQMQSRMAHTKEDAQAFDPLEFDRFTRVQELTRMMAESVNDVATVQRNLLRSLEGAEDDLNAQARQARELQRDLLRTRMVEFDGIAERLYGVVRQTAKEADKTVKLDIIGSSIEMDRGVLDRMTPAFEHILRNAVVHGIEDAAVRVAAGKAATGSISVTVHQEGNDVSVTFSDDGGGLHLDKIRAKAIASQLISADAGLSDAEAAQLLFTPGFSTAAQVTELSGRGIGMDVVLTELNALGGVVETRTEAGLGTTFRLVLPLTTAVTQVVMLRMGELSFGVPSNLIETVLRAPAQEVQTAYQRGLYTLGGQDIAFYWGGALLQVSGHSSEPPARMLPVAVLRSAGQRLALHVDEVLGNREVVVKNLGPQLARLPGLAGMSVLASGAVALIYNPVALATVYGAQARALMASHAPANANANANAPAGQPAQSSPAGTAALQAPLVLVVDDSITVRRVTQRLLKREGYRVALANDGLHALEVLAQEKPTVVLSDIEMPRMDGFDLVRNIRSDAQLCDLPVIMITSRIAQKHRDHALELGVDHYLGKPYSEDELLALVRSYCAEAVAQ
jgi:chemosensory pili system protein ChpA (sensor histidine kinase/response regulator)